MDEFRRQAREMMTRAVERAAELLDGLRERLRERRRRSTGSARPGRERAPEPSRAFDDESAIVVATADDDVASVVGRIDIADAPEVVLIARRDARALRRPTAWPHIAAHVRRRGIELAVVSPRNDVRSHARANGLRAARTPAGLRPRRVYVRPLDRVVTVPRMPWERVIRGGMVLVAVGAIGIVGCYRVPSAVVTIVPESEVISVTAEARPNAIVDRNDLATETILVSTIRRQLFTVVTTTTTGEVEIGDEFATLDVTFENASSEVVLVPRLSQLLTEDGAVFLTEEDVDVPAEGTASVSAIAELPGEAGNVAAGSIVSAGSEVPAAVTITSSTSASGGTNQLTVAVSQDDVDRVRSIAGSVLNRVAVGALQQAVEDEELGTLIPSSVTAAIFSELPVQLLDEPSDIFVVEYVITAAGLVVSPTQAAAYAELLVREELPPGYALLPGSVDATATPLDDRGRVEVSATARIAELSVIAVTANEITGMRPSEASALLQRELNLPAAPSIEIQPTFLPWVWLPRRASSIELVIAGPQAVEAAEDAADDDASADDAADEAADDDAAGDDATDGDEADDDDAAASRLRGSDRAAVLPRLAVTAIAGSGMARRGRG